MRALLRTITLLTALIAFVLQLPLAGAGVGCRMEAHAGLNGGMQMPGMQMAGDMAGMQMAGDMAHPADAAAPGAPMPEDEAPCDHGPSSAACQSMASCASVVAVLLPVDVPAAHGTAVASVLPAVVRAPVSRSIPPELPPPRA